MNIHYSHNKEDINVIELKEIFQRVATWKMPTDIKEWEEMLENTPLLITAFDDDKIIGFARMLTDYVRWGEIYDVVVDESYQGKGIGKQLILHLTNHPKVKRVRTISLGTEDKTSFYEKLGFRNINNYNGHYLILVRKDRDHTLA
ncbi:ribosomal protein S18 acetylase RimI-like enzyme [Bacillus sp. RC240]|uniref:GNAT family N-acetyltransferase n=1 Tax=Bacillus sp. RC240 TaxID=3156285 RepID=UPI003837AB84